MERDVLWKYPVGGRTTGRKFFPGCVQAGSAEHLETHSSFPFSPEGLSFLYSRRHYIENNDFFPQFSLERRVWVKDCVKETAERMKVGNSFEQ